MKRTLYCGGPAVETGRWLASAGSSRDLAQAWPQLHDRTVIGTYRGRTAVALACRLLGIGAGHEVLVPAYNCGTELDPVQKAGAKLVGYRVNRRCEIDLADLQRRCTPATRAVYVIHYFGWEQPMQELRSWCDARGLLLLEDCALALFSAGQSGSIGRKGDAVIYSLPKTFGFCHGGFLALPASRPERELSLAPAGSSTLRREIKYSAKATAMRGLARAGFYGAFLGLRQAARGDAPPAEAGEGLADMPPDYYFKPADDADRALHPRARTVAASFDWEAIVRSRRANYLHLAGAFSQVQSLEPLFPELPAGVCPLSFPLLVTDRDARVKALQARGIAALPWWAGFHQPGIDWAQFPDACWLKHHVLTLPIHQGLGPEQLAYMVETVAQTTSP